VPVTTQAGCSWTTSGAPPWLTLSGGASGQGSATIAVTLNTANTPRSATLTIAGQAVTVTQAGRASAPTNVRVQK
jgi:ABC-type arginine transport system ATPase subunit